MINSNANSTSYIHYKRIKYLIYNIRILIQFMEKTNDSMMDDGWCLVEIGWFMWDFFTQSFQPALSYYIIFFNWINHPYKIYLWSEKCHSL